MQNRFIHSPLVCFAILAAFVHQLGAGACGCIEHNGWVQVACGVLDSASLLDTQTGHGHSPRSTAGASDLLAPSLTHAHCDECQSLVYTASPCRSLEEIAVSVWSSTVESLAEAATVSVIEADSRTWGIHSVPAISDWALPLRAELQIYLI